MGHQAGFVNIVGNPNVGKSTLMNALVGERLSIMTSKSQTTRQRILGILNNTDYQIVFSDTPGIVRPAYKLHESMLEEIRLALIDADIIMYVVEFGESEMNPMVGDFLKESEIPLMIVINKIDLGDQEKVTGEIEAWKQKFPGAEVIPVSALHKFNIQTILNWITDHLPEHPAYYDKEDLSDRNVRFFVAEMIREHILIQYRKEIPYSVEVIVDTYEESEKIDKIHALIFVTRESQRKILIGKNGNAIKNLGISARLEMEKFLQKKVFLEMSVKVEKDWRDSKLALGRFGYQMGED
nr:GTPase Era [Bacteroidota bacterium]